MLTESGTWLFNADDITLINLAGDQDHFSPWSLAKKTFDHLATEPMYHFETVEGGSHGSGYSPFVADFLAAQCQELLTKKMARDIPVIESP